MTFATNCLIWTADNNTLFVGFLGFVLGTVFVATAEWISGLFKK